MIATSVVDEVRRLLRQRTLSQRDIARRLGISRGTVSAIYLGKRQDHKSRNRRENEVLAPTGPLERCPGCGGLVYMPCLLCRIRALKQTRRQRIP